MHFPAPASSLAEPPPAASPQLGRLICQQAAAAIREDALSSAGACCWCLLVLCCCCCCVDDGLSCFFRLVTFYTCMMIVEVAAICIYAMQSPAPASRLAEPPLAALGRWICQGLRSARIRGLLLVVAAANAAAAASTTTAYCLFMFACLFMFGHISYWCDEILTRCPMCTCASYMGFYTAICRLYCCTPQCSKSLSPGLF